MKRGLIIFDFDGVLADSFETFYPLMRDMMKHVGFSLSPDQYRNFFIGHSFLHFNFHIPGFKLSLLFPCRRWDSIFFY